MPILKRFVTILRIPFTSFDDYIYQHERKKKLAMAILGIREQIPFVNSSNLTTDRFDSSAQVWPELATGYAPAGA